MEAIIAMVMGLVGNLGGYVNAILAVLTAIIALCMLIPGEQPEKALQGIVDFISKFSKK